MREENQFYRYTKTSIKLTMQFWMIKKLTLYIKLQMFYALKNNDIQFDDFSIIAES